MDFTTKQWVGVKVKKNPQLPLRVLLGEGALLSNRP